MSERSLAEISYTSDDEIVRIWLAERGLVAVERALMEKLAAPSGGVATYYTGVDRYYDRAVPRSIKVG